MVRRGQVAGPGTRSSRAVPADLGKVERRVNDFVLVRTRLRDHRARLVGDERAAPEGCRAGPAPLVSDPVLVHEMSVAPARSPDIRMEQLPDPQPLIDACLCEHGIEGSIAGTGTWYSEGPMDVGASIREMTWIDGS